MGYRFLTHSHMVGSSGDHFDDHNHVAAGALTSDTERLTRRPGPSGSLAF